MDNIIICPMCKQNLIIDEYRNHSCPIGITNVKTIGILEDYGTLTNRNGDQVRSVKTIEGEILRLVKCEHQIPHNLPDQPKGNREKINREGNRICFVVLSN